MNQKGEPSNQKVIEQTRMRRHCQATVDTQQYLSSEDNKHAYVSSSDKPTGQTSENTAASGCSPTTINSNTAPHSQTIFKPSPLPLHSSNNKGDNELDDTRPSEYHLRKRVVQSNNQGTSNKRVKKEGVRSRNKNAAGNSHSTKLPETIKAGMLDLSEFKLLDMLGEGCSGKVFRAKWHGEIVALKVCDLSQQSKYLEEVVTEVEVYNSLKDLQGHYIPRIRAAGIYNWTHFAIVTDLAGSPINVDQLDYAERQKAVEALSEIHRRGFLHKDIRRENILFQRSNDGLNIFFIDFAFSKFENNKDKFLEEMTTLKALLNLEEITEQKDLCLT